jgi:epoxide hydrolase 4
MESHFATINGIKLHYLKAGKGSLMLFLHGFPEYSGAWHEQMAHFSANFTCVAPDLRGFNLSDKPKDVKAYKASVIVEDIRQLITHLGFEKCILVAHDWGGAIAWTFAIQHPELLEKLVILNAPHPVPFARELASNKAQQQASDYMLYFRTPEAVQELAANDFELLRKKMGFSRIFKENPQKAQTYLAAWSRAGALDASLNYYRVSPLMPPSQESQGAAKLTLNPQDFRVNVKTLILWGMKDLALLPALLEGLDELIPDLTVKKYENCSHWLLHEMGADIAKTIEEFVV